MAELRRRPAVFGLIAFLLFFAVFLAGFGPFDFDFHPGDMEGGWILASTYAGLHHFAYGTQFVFTNGPLFPLYHREWAGPMTGAYVLLRLVVVLYLAASFARLGNTSRPIGWLATIAGAAILFPTISGQTNDATLLLVPMVTALMVLARRAGWPVLLVGIVLSATLALAKISFIPFCVGAFVLTDIALWSRRRPPFAFVAYVVASWVIFVIAGQRWSDFIPFLLGNYDMTAGYSAALSKDGLLIEPLAFLAFTLVVLGVVIGKQLANVRKGHETLLHAVLLLLLMLWFLFIGVKAGFVRHDLHSAAAWGMLLYLMVLLGLPGVLPNWRPWVTVSLYIMPLLVLAAGGLLLSSNRYFVEAVTGSPRIFATQLTEGVAFVTNPTAWLEKEQQRANTWDELVRTNQPLPKIPGRIDAISNVQQSIIAAGLDYWPRPTIQENMTFSPALIARNRAFLEGPDAPQTLLFSPGATDTRHPASVEGSLWPLLLADYAITGEANQQLILTRRPTPLPIAESEPAAIATTFGADLPVPAGNKPLFLRLDIRETPLGKLSEQLLKPPLVYLVATYADGTSERSRLIPGMISEGMLVSPTIRTIDDYRRLARGEDLAGLSFPVALRVETGGPWAYQPEIGGSFTTLTIPAN